MIKESGNLFGFEDESEDSKKVEITPENKEEKKDSFLPTSNTLEIGGGEETASEFEKNLLGESEDEDEDEKSEDDSDETKEEDKKEDKKEKEEKEESKKESKKELPKEELNDSTYSFKALASFLDEEGVVDFEDSKDYEDSPELLIGLVQSKINEEVNSYKESLPEVVSELVAFIEKGGDPSKFLATINKEVDFESLDLDDESNQELIVREYLKSQDNTKEEIDELINDYKEALVLEKQARFASRKIEKIQEKSKQRLLEEQEFELEAQRDRVEKHKTKVRETVLGASELAGLELPKKEKETFLKYMLDINPKSGLTQYQEAISKNAMQTQIELAYLKFKDYDFSKEKAKAKSEAAKDIRNRIFTKTETTAKGKTREDQGVQSFDAFKAMFGRK